MRILTKAFLAVAIVTLVTRAHALTLFNDDFDTEHGGVGVLNYSGFLNWTVTSGAVDLIPVGSDFDFYPGNGLYVDLDGSIGQAGIITTKNAIDVSPGDYVLSFMLGGNARNTTSDTVNVAVKSDFISQSYTLAGSAPLTTYYLPFSVLSATTINLVFEATGGDNIGAILDNVNLDMVEPQDVPDGGMSGVLLGMGLVVIGFGRKLVK